MSTEQKPQQGSTIDITQQATTPTPETKPSMNPKRVAAGKATAEKTRLAREAQKRSLAEANIIIEKNKAERAASKARGKDPKDRVLPTITEEPEPQQQGTTTAGVSTFTTGQ